MKYAVLLVVLTLVVATQAVLARSYVPVGGDAVLAARGRLLPPDGEPRALNPLDRPRVAGVRPVEVELLVDALRRKQPRTIGDSTERAYESIVRNSLRDPVKRSHIRGMLAEARFLHENPAWGYVRSPTASQHDVYQWVRGRATPYTAQIKTHVSADPAIYARDMRVDFRSDLFLVPDEHVRGLREYWRSQVGELEGRGLQIEATEARRQLGRIQPLGFGNLELEDDLARASRYVLQQQGRTYVSLGSGRNLVLDANGRELFRAIPRAPRSGGRAMTRATGLANERVRTVSLSSIGSRYAYLAWRGVVGVGIAMAILEPARLLYSYGDVQAALRSPYFYTRLGGTVTSLTLAFSVGGQVGSLVTLHSAPTLAGWSVAVGLVAGLVSGTAAGIAGYIGGESTVRSVVEWLRPELLYQAEEAAVRQARTVIETKIQRAQLLSEQ